MNTTHTLKFFPLTMDRWNDFEELFGKRGACGGCWCMWWRIKRSDFNRQKGEGNRQAMEKLVESRKIPGILAYQRGKVVGWCSIAPREDFPVLLNSRILKPVDDQPVWSIVCFFISKEHRRSGLTGQLIKAAIDYARPRGAKIIEAYPVDHQKNQIPAVFAYTGFASTFRKAGFQEVTRRSPTRPIMRFYLTD